MYVYIYICIYIYVYVYVCICIYIYIYVCMYVYIMYMRARARVCVRVCVYVHAFPCTFSTYHIHKHTNKPTHRKQGAGWLNRKHLMSYQRSWYSLGPTALEFRPYPVLFVTIHRGHKLTALDANGYSDPYVEVIECVCVHTCEDVCAYVHTYENVYMKMYIRICVCTCLDTY